MKSNEESLFRKTSSFYEDDEIVEKLLRMWCIAHFFRLSTDGNVDICMQRNTLSGRIKSRDYHCRSAGGRMFSEGLLFSHFNLPA